MSRTLSRSPETLRPIHFQIPGSKHAEGSCLVQFGDTHVLCTASVEEKIPHFLKNSGKGWVTAEYGMLPRATHSRTDRESAKGKQSGRTHEIQRLIGRSLRAVMDFAALGERQIRLDCDVLQADGGTRTAAISGAYIALYLALNGLIAQRKLTKMPLLAQVAAVSCGLVKDAPLLDLDYAEDSQADADMNLVMSSEEGGKFIEIQATGEQRAFCAQEFSKLLEMGGAGIQDIFLKQREALQAYLGSLSNNGVV
ncbi:MAG: ribonuclease PH [Alphaproteobacteria bacterium]